MMSGIVIATVMAFGTAWIATAMATAFPIARTVARMTRAVTDESAQRTLPSWNLPAIQAGYGGRSG
jgi:hypothetical protein